MTTPSPGEPPLINFARAFQLASAIAFALVLSPEAIAAGKFPRPILGYGLNPGYCAGPTVPSSMSIPNHPYSTDLSLCEAWAAYGNSQGLYAPNPTILQYIAPPPWYQCVIGPPPPHPGALGCLIDIGRFTCPPGSTVDSNGTDCDVQIDWSRNAGSCPAHSSGAGGSAPMVGNPINVGTGNKYLQQEDFSTGSLRFSRHYNSQVIRNGKGLSFSWSHTWSRWIYPSPTSSTQATLYRPDGRTVGATLINTTVSNGQQIWTLDAFSGHQLIRLTDPTGATTLGWTVISDDGNIEGYDGNGVLLWIETSQERTQELIYSDGTSSGGYALDGNGNPTATVLPPGVLIGVAEDFGRSISFGYDTFGHLVRATDGLGQTYRYGYDTNANLASVTYPDGKVRQYLNDEAAKVAASVPQAVTGIVDENGARYATYTYDSEGRATSSSHFQDAQATIPVDQTQIAFSTDVSGNPLSSVVTDARGTQRTYGLTSILNLVKGTGVNQPGGAGCGPAGTSATYDTNGNVTGQIDFDGNVICYASDSVRNLETARLEGLASGASCPAALSTYTPVSGTPQRLTQTQWHPTFRMKTAEAAPLKTTYWVYNGQPDPNNGNAPASCAPTTLTVTEPGALLHFDGANGSTTFTDVYGNTWSAIGGAALSTAQFRFGTASLGLNGTNAAITSASGSALIPGASDFTYEAWIYLTGYGTTQAVIFDKQANSGSNAGVILAVNSSSHVLFALADNGSGWSVNFSGSTALSLNTWYHVAYVRSGSTWTIYLNGNQDGQQTGTSITVADDGSNQLVGAAWNSSTGSFFPGYLDDVRITKGVAVYTANFTPPTAQLSTVAQANPVTVTGLNAGTTYTFTVTATNASGTGPASGASNAVTPIGPPGAPTIGTATGGNAAAIVTFTAPSSNGGSPITSYTATSTPGGKTASGSASPITVGGLTNQTAYTFKVTATNSAGTSPPSAASNSVTPSNGPTVSISTPGSGATGSAPATFSLTATAAPGPSGGTVSSVQYYANGAPIGPAIAASPYTYSWTDVDAGTYSLTAVATDNYGTVGISSPVSITVQESATSVKVYYIYADQIDTPRVITRSSDNQVVWRWDAADPFGAAQPNQNPANLGVFVYNERFPGQLYDAETGTHYNYFRNYDPGLGRYVQSDPIGLKAGVNTYNYATTDPVRRADPLGLYSCTCTLSYSYVDPKTFSKSWCVYRCRCWCGPGAHGKTKEIYHWEYVSKGLTPETPPCNLGFSDFIDFDSAQMTDPVSLWYETAQQLQSEMSDFCSCGK